MTGFKLFSGMENNGAATFSKIKMTEPRRAYFRPCRPINFVRSQKDWSIFMGNLQRDHRLLLSFGHTGPQVILEAKSPGITIVLM